MTTCHFLPSATCTLNVRDRQVHGRAQDLCPLRDRKRRHDGASLDFAVSCRYKGGAIIMLSVCLCCVQSTCRSTLRVNI